jgi:DNA-binding NarL/FixJ family response regulator
MEALAAPDRRIRVLIVDDQRLFVEAVEVILACEHEVDVVGRASDGRQAVELFETLLPDVILMDIDMPVMDGIDATRAIRERRAEASVLMLTGSSAGTDVDRARRAGAAGYVTKERIAADLIASIRAVAPR